MTNEEIQLAPLEASALGARPCSVARQSSSASTTSASS